MIVNSVTLQELEPKIGEEFCKLWNVDQSSPSGRTPTRTANNVSRRGQPSESAQSNPHPSPGQWQGAQSNVGYTTIQQVYTTPTPLPSYPCTHPYSSTHHPCPLCRSPVCCSPAHGRPCPPSDTLWCACSCTAVSVPSSGFQVPWRHYAATPYKDNGAAATRNKRVI